MFEATKLGRALSKKEFEKHEDELHFELLQVQRELRESNIPVVVIVYGLEGVGKGEVVNRLNKWLDSRGMQTFAFWDETDEERERPRYWRFWRSMPLRGQISILFGGWYQAPIEGRYLDHFSDEDFNFELNRIVNFERMLTLDGALFVKFWFHMPEKAQKARLKELSGDERSLWKMHPRKKSFSRHYANFERLAERLIRNTDRGFAPWYLIEATDREYRDLTVGRTLLAAIRTRLENPPVPEHMVVSHSPILPRVQSARLTVLDKVDLGKRLDKQKYRSLLAGYQQHANRLAWQAYNRKRSSILVFEGWDAAGKGGVIRRFTEGIDARLYRAIQVGAPTDEEKAYHYLWRFWRHVPRAGRISIYDRSWYGRVLVERVEGLAVEQEWQRAFAEINQFEEQLVERGTMVLKFWLHISADEQLKRFKDREQTPHKQHKIRDEDWRNRGKWNDYTRAVNEMVERTSTDCAPWTLIAANDKRHARIAVLRTICESMEAALGITRG